jgi:hypothetical protein
VLLRGAGWRAARVHRDEAVRPRPGFSKRGGKASPISRWSNRLSHGLAKGARTGQTSAVPTCCTDRQGTLQAVGRASLGPLHLARDSWNGTSVQFNSSSTGGPIESLSYADDQATETKRGEAAREASEAGEETEEPKPEGGQCGRPENRTLLVPFQLVSPILGGWCRSNLIGLVFRIGVKAGAASRSRA